MESEIQATKQGYVYTLEVYFGYDTEKIAGVQALGFADSDVRYMEKFPQRTVK